MTETTHTTGASALLEPTDIDSVVTHHLDGFRSGVARFNELLAEQLGVPLYGLADSSVEETRCSLFSFKVSELGEDMAADVAALVERMDWHGELYLHDWSGLELERELVRRARRVHCGNLEIQEQVQALNPSSQAVWTPGLILDQRPYTPTEISVFSFGMAHKIRVDMFERLRDLLDSSGKTYAVYVSAANHETSSPQDAQLVFEEMHEIFPALYFLGNLSDVAIYNELRRATFFASFFPAGARGNNTSIAAALELGSVVITNLDRHSPPELQHLDNILDIEQLEEIPSDPLVLQRISVRAMETGRARSWSRLTAALRSA